jgi:hypothetical protein
MSDNSINIPSNTDKVIVLEPEIGPTGSSNSSALINATGATGINIVKINNLLDTEEFSVVSKIHLEKYLSFIDDVDTKQIVTILTNDPEAVQDIINMIDLILADGKIDISDAPLLIGLIKKIVTLRTKNLKLSQNLTLDHFLDIIKLVFTILAKEGVLKIANTDEFITDINKVIPLIKSGEQIVESMPCFPICIGWFLSKK